MTNFSEEQLTRYSRHIRLDDLGIEGQTKIMESKVLVIGAGGLGSPVLFYLAAAGVGQIGIVDSDAVDLSNLQRQIIHSSNDVDRPKVVSASEKIHALNPDVEVVPIHELARADNIRRLIRGYDFIIDATDNFSSKFLINDACIMEHKPFSHGGVLRFHGQTMTIIPLKSACYRCVFQEVPPPDAASSCSQAGILGAIPGILGAIQATEALKFITGVKEPLTNQLLTFDARKMSFRNVALKQRSTCEICGKAPTISTL